MLNKTDVSNQITGLRPIVKQAIAHFMHGLTKEIDKCQNRKGGNAKKFHKRAENLRKEAMLVKDIRIDSISRYALTMDFSERQKLLNDVNLSLKDKVIIKIATLKNVQSHIEAFRKEHPEWVNKLPPLLETLGILTKHKKKVQKAQEKQKRKLARREALGINASFTVSSLEESDRSLDCSAKEQKVPKTSKSNGKFKSQPLENKANTLKNIKASVEPKKHISEDSDDSSDDSETERDTLGNASEESDESENPSVDGGEDSGSDGSVSGDDGEGSEDQNGTEEDHDSDVEVSASEEEEGTDSHSVKKADSFSAKKKVVESSKKNNFSKAFSGSLFAEVRRFADLQKEEVPKRGVQDKVKPESSDNYLNETEPVEEDPFFVTEENRFLKTVAVKRRDGEGLESSSKTRGDLSDEKKSQWSIDGKKLKGNRGERRGQFLGRDINKERPMFNQNRPTTWKKGENSGNSNHRFGPNHNKFGSERRNVWKSSKNPTFGKESSTGQRNERDRNLKQNGHPAQASTDEKLHPSWEAKRKQKIAIDNFQGKKIKFNDD